MKETLEYLSLHQNDLFVTLEDLALNQKFVERIIQALPPEDRFGGYLIYHVTLNTVAGLSKRALEGVTAHDANKTIGIYGENTHDGVGHNS